MYTVTGSTLSVRRETEPGVLLAVYDETEARVPGGMAAVIRSEREPWTPARWLEACRLGALLLIGVGGEPAGWLLLDAYHERPGRLYVHACRWAALPPRRVREVWRRVKAMLPPGVSLAANIEQERPRTRALARRLAILVEE